MKYLHFVSFFGCFINTFWKIREKNLQSGCFREDQSGYSKHNFFFFFFFLPNLDKEKLRVGYIFMKNPFMIFQNPCMHGIHQKV